MSGRRCWGHIGYGCPRQLEKKRPRAVGAGSGGAHNGKQCQKPDIRLFPHGWVECPLLAAVQPILPLKHPMHLRKCYKKKEQVFRCAPGRRSFLGSCLYAHVGRQASCPNLSESFGFYGLSQCLGACCCSHCFCEHLSVQPSLIAQPTFGLTPKPPASMLRSRTQAMECEVTDCVNPHSLLPKQLSSLCNLMLSKAIDNF